MTKPQSLIANINGINNRIDPKRLPVDYESATGYVAEMVNMRIGQTGDASLDFGYSQVLSGNYHSLFCDGGDCLVGKGKGLYQVVKDGSSITTRGLRDSLSGLPMAFCRIGQDIYYSDTVSKNGVVRNNVSMDWPKQKYLQDTDRVFINAPIAKHMDELNGRMWMIPASDPNIIIWSEQGQVGLYNLGANFRRLESDIIMIAAVKHGLFLSTTERILFLQVTGGIGIKHVANYPAIEWSLAHRAEKASKLKIEIDGVVRLWNSEKGPCVGLPTGEMVCMTEDNLLLSGCDSSGASIVIGDYLYTTTG